MHSEIGAKREHDTGDESREQSKDAPANPS
jgi:hypothetical protein